MQDIFSPHSSLPLVHAVPVLVNPPPQTLLQRPHRPHPLTLQLTEQACVLQRLCLFNAGHLFPPFFAPTCTCRFCFCKPPPQTLLQRPHRPHPLTLQLTGGGR